MDRLAGRAVDVRSARPPGFPRRGREYLRRLGFTRQVPRPRHAQGDFAAQERFKADFRARMEDLAREDPDRAVEVWAFDEHRAGLKPVIRKVWARRGSARWLAATSASNGSMFLASSGQQPAPSSGSWPTR